MIMWVVVCAGLKRGFYLEQKILKERAAAVVATSSTIIVVVGHVLGEDYAVLSMLSCSVEE